MITRYVGIGGNGPGAGKDTVATFLVEEARKEGWETQVFGFGDLIRQQLAYGLSRTLDIPVNLVVNWMTDRKTKEISRTSQQEWPVLCRELTGDAEYMIKMWTDWAKNLDVESKGGDPVRQLIINPSIRRENESNMIRNLGGKVIYINRTGLEESTGHECERAFGPQFCDLILDNSRDPEYLRTKVVQLWHGSIKEQ